MDVGQSYTEYGVDSLKFVPKVLTPLFCADVFNRRLHVAIWMQTLIFGDLSFHLWNSDRFKKQRSWKNLVSKNCFHFDADWSQNVCILPVPTGLKLKIGSYLSFLKAFFIKNKLSLIYKPKPQHNTILLTDLIISFLLNHIKPRYSFDF